MTPSRLLFVSMLLMLSACVPRYTLVAPGPNPVAKQTLVVQPTTPWNKIPSGNRDVPWEESWTKNGPLLDTIAFVGGLPDGQALVKQKKKDDHQVPTFRATMSPEDLVSMVEGNYRVGGVDKFTVTSVAPVAFLGDTGVQMDFSYVMADNLVRHGRCVMGIVDKQFYAPKLEGAADHYFTAVLPEFDAMVRSTSLQ